MALGPHPTSRQDCSGLVGHPLGSVPPYPRTQRTGQDSDIGSAGDSGTDGVLDGGSGWAIWSPASYSLQQALPSPKSRGACRTSKSLGGLDPLSNIYHCFPKLKALTVTVKMTRHTHHHHNPFKISQKSISQRRITKHWLCLSWNFGASKVFVQYFPFNFFFFFFTKFLVIFSMETVVWRMQSISDLPFLPSSPHSHAS